MDQISAVLKRAMPFQMVSDDMLRGIVKLAKSRSFARGDMIYDRGDEADDIYIVASGSVSHALRTEEDQADLNKIMRSGDVFGWAAVLDGQRGRMAKTVCLERTEVVQIDGEELMALIKQSPVTGDVIMSRFATMITKEFSAPDSVAARVPHFPVAEISTAQQGDGVGSGWALTFFRLAQWIKSPKPYLMLLGFAILLGLWYLTVEVWKLPRFADMPGLTVVVRELFNPNPTYGLSVYTPEYYQHIWVSIRRVSIAFFLATALGVPLGLFMGWSKIFREYVFPIFETLRPIPILAWVPLAILMFTGTETPVIFLTFLASFFATALNTMLGVESIDESYSRAAYCLGASKWQVFREVIVPGAMPFIFTGLQISVGVAWFSLVAGEMVSGEFGLGYVINTSYTMVRYPTIVIGMITLGAVGYVTSALVRMVGDYMMQWRVRELALGGR
ncbi:ABC transporter permease subunit [Methylibium sp.]|uniref:ABC transporter permease subunit n=1 Tax=Methylibium sp. TaxID=2067992 RepID=UPI003D148EE5